MKRSAPKKSSLLAKYSLQYQKNPRSRVFAPLAETYRKLGMYDEAIKVLRDGIKLHPTYTLGYIVLAHIYFDQENYEISYNTVRPFVSQNLENITLQKLFAKICINLGYLEEALQTFKYLLLINPKDIDIAAQVKLLEDDLLTSDISTEEETNGFVEKRLNQFNIEEDDWIQVNFNKSNQARKTDEEHWEMQKNETISALDSFKNDLKSGKLDVEEHDLDDAYFYEEHDLPDEDVLSTEASSNSEKVKDAPIITHTLVNLYCNQGHLDKALELIESILKIHPNDSASLEKKDEILALMHPVDDKEYAEEDGHDELLQLIEGKRKKDLEAVGLVEKKLYEFLEKIKLRATQSI